MRGEAAVLAQQQVQQQVVLGRRVLHHLQRHLQLLLLRIPRAQPLHARAQVLVQLQRDTYVRLNRVSTLLYHLTGRPSPLLYYK